MPSTVHLLTASTIRARKLSSALKTPVATSEPRARMLRSFQVPDANGSSRGVTHSTDGSSGSGSLRLHHQGHYHGVPKWSCGNGPCICSQLFSSLSVFDFHKIWIRTQGLGGCFKVVPTLKRLRPRNARTCQQKSSSLTEGSWEVLSTHQLSLSIFATRHCGFSSVFCLI